MTTRVFILGTALYIFLVAVLIPFFGNIPYHTIFTSDAAEYSKGAINLLTQGFYSIDGVTPFLEREPGMSFFLAVLYGLFGIENSLALIAVQAVLLIVASYFFCLELSKRYTHRLANIAFILLLTSGSIVRTVFAASREALSVVLVMIIVVLLLRALRTKQFRYWLILSLITAFLILFYFPILFMPLGMSVFLLYRRECRIGVIASLILASLLVSLWAFRNASIDGKFRVIGNQRTAVMWYVRGEQSERVRGMEPLWCLYAEYISRDWTGRSDACSFNGLMHARWPTQIDRTADFTSVGIDGQAKVRANFLSYLNFSLFEILELHLPFVGGGVSTSLNVYIALSHLLILLGFFIGLPTLTRDYRWLWLMPILYNTLVYILTDAIPRYLVPFLPFYAVIAAFGYTWLLDRIRKRL